MSIHQNDEQALKEIEWLLQTNQSESLGLSADSMSGQPYGDLTELNTNRLILDSIGKEVLAEVVSDYLDLLDTSAAVYEANGDYATGIFTSSWCRFMDETSRNLSQENNREALACGQWHCHESCWKTSKTSIVTGEPADMECAGGIRIYAVPVKCGDKTIGSINFGYGDPPTDELTLQKLAEKYQVPLEELQLRARQYHSRPAYIIELAKRRLHTAARLIGEMVERRQMEERYRHLSKRLSSSNAELEQFAYIAAHDLQEPLRNVVNFTSLLSSRYQNKIDDQADRYIKHIVEATKRMQLQIDELLQFASMEANNNEFKPVDCTALVDNAVRNLSRAIKENGVAVNHDALPVIMADAAQLQQVFENLLGNAIKFHGPQSPAVHITARRDGHQWLFSVKDNGIGFEMEFAERIFSLFRRLHTADEYPGTGIGLAICKKVVERHGGNIWAESTPEKGSTFFFTIPDTPAEPVRANA